MLVVHTAAEPPNQGGMCLLTLPPNSEPLQPRLWTDDYSDLFRLIKH